MQERFRKQLAPVKAQLLKSNMHFKEHLVDFLGSRYLRYGVMGFLCLVAGTIAWAIVPHRPKTPPIHTDAVAYAPRPDAVALAQRITTDHLFGERSVDATIASSASAGAISIEGLFYSPDPDLARVILEVSGTAGVFKTGDTLPDGERVKAIGLNAVQIANGESLHEVDLDTKFGNDSPGTQLSGMPELYAQQDSFPGAAPLTGSAASVVQRLAPVMLPQTGDPLAQMRALRQQLIRPVNPKN